MKLPLRWAQSFAPFTATAQEFADKMTMSGSKVETFYSEADALHNVVVGRVDSLVRHPDSDHLWVCQVDVGDEKLQIVTGAQNLKEGDLCPVALHGAKLPNGTEIRRGKLRGQESQGMLCSLSELGLTVHDFPHAAEDGILVLEQEAPLGQSAAVALGMDDITFEFEITPNRPDCLSVRGLAREAAATFGVAFNNQAPPAPPAGSDIEKLLRVRVEATDTCPRYSAAIVNNVRIAESPRWMRERLRTAGVRPINNIVDITNYVMLEYGQPMHAFDYAYVNGGAITVRRAAAGESIVTLDDVTRTLDEEMMVIADEKGPIAVAGIMGGEYSGVYNTTKMVVFESANFEGTSVRATSKRLGLRTESSTRFEKGLDPNTCAPALARALKLVQLLDAGDVVPGVLDDYPTPRSMRTLPLNLPAIEKLLGIAVGRQKAVDILTPLGFVVADDDVITIPTARADVSRNCDIAEEIARFVGYNNIPLTILRGAAKARTTPRQAFDAKCIETLCGCGLWQCETFSFYSPKDLDMVRLPEDDARRQVVRIQNPLGEETSIMRSTALPSILAVAARNWAARAASCAVFEKATEYLPTGDADALPQENAKLVMAAYGEGWDYLAIKGVAEALVTLAGASGCTAQRNSEGTTFHPGRCANLYVSLPDGSQALLGTIGEVHPAVCENYDIKTRVVAADLSLEVLFAARGGVAQYQPLPRFPAITRDLAVVADAALPAAEVEGAIRTAAGKRLESLSLFDVYTGDKIEDGKKSLAYSLVLRDRNTTLTDADADAVVKKVLKQLNAIDVQLRS